MNPECRHLRRLPPALTGLLTLFFLFVHPGAGEHRLFLAPSANALWVSRHHAPGPRLPRLAASPGPRALAVAAGLKTGELDKLRDDPATAFGWGQLLPGDALLALEPRLGALGGRGVVLVSRVGWRQLPLRLWSEFVGFRSWKLETRAGGRVVFVRHKPGRTPWRATLVEGWWIAVRHEDPTALREVLARFDRQLPSLSSLRPALLRPLHGHQPHADRGVWTGSRAFPGSLWIHRLEGPQFRLLVSGDSVSRFLADADATCGPFPARLLGPGVLASSPCAGGRLFLLGHPYSWRWTLLPLPSPVWIAPAPSDDLADTLAQQTLALFGDLSGFNWIPERGNPGFGRFRPSESPPASLLRKEEWPAWARIGDQVVLSGGERTLQRLRQRLASSVADFEASRSEWNSDSSLAWIDVHALIDLFEPLARLALLSRDDTSTSRRRLEDTLRAWRAVRYVKCERPEITSENAVEVVWVE